MKILAVIPARGGSKGVPMKNIKSIAGKPLLAWSIEAAQKSKYINRIIVSTDCLEISNVAIHYGAEVLKRPDDISGDSATSESALIHTLNELKTKENYSPDLLVFIQCTSPLTITEDIDGCIQKLLNENADSSLSVSDFHYFLWREDELKKAIGINHDMRYRPRRQDREIQYIETGSVYVMRASGFLKFCHRFFGKTVLYKIPNERVFEIDEPMDFIVAETLMKFQLHKNRVNVLPNSITALVFDFDGVMTDNKVYLNEFGHEMVKCDRSDGMAINLLKKSGYRLAVMSTEENDVVTQRCKKLKIECFQNLGFAKHETLIQWAESNQFKLEQVLYVGNDINDIECMKIAGFAAAPADAHDNVKSIADIILKSEGGKGVVRELYELLVK